MNCNCSSGKAVQAVGQYFDFSSIGEFFSSGFGQTLSNLATTVAKTEIVGALGPGPPSQQTPPANRPVTPSARVISPQVTPYGIAGPGGPATSPGSVSTPPGTYNAMIPGTPNFGLPAQPSSPGATPQSWLGSGSGAAAEPQQTIPGMSNTTLLLLGGLFLLVLLRR